MNTSKTATIALLLAIWSSLLLAQEMRPAPSMLERHLKPGQRVRLEGVNDSRLVILTERLAEAMSAPTVESVAADHVVLNDNGKKHVIALQAVHFITDLNTFKSQIEAGRRSGDRSDQISRANDEKSFSFLAFDGFEGKLGLNWQPVRHDPTHISLSKNPGHLTITTQQGTIHGDERARGEPLAKNLFVIDNPLSKDSDFVATACIGSFTPTGPYQQAGLICYDDDDNYLKWGYEFHWQAGGGTSIGLVTETAGTPNHAYIKAHDGKQALWMRLAKYGNVYSFSASDDGKKFTEYGEVAWGNGAPKKLGILAKNGGIPGADEVDAAFDFFELRSPPPTKTGRD
jgi:regulation of enolase protein 1 (concanavalin A-like superfamily)